MAGKKPLTIHDDPNASRFVMEDELVVISPGEGLPVGSMTEAEQRAAWERRVARAQAAAAPKKPPVTG